MVKSWGFNDLNISYLPIGNIEARNVEPGQVKVDYMTRRTKCQSSKWYSH